MISGAWSILKSMELKGLGACVSKHLIVGCKAEKLHLLFIILDFYPHVLVKPVLQQNDF